MLARRSHRSDMTSAFSKVLVSLFLGLMLWNLVGVGVWLPSGFARDGTKSGTTATAASDPPVSLILAGDVMLSGGNTIGKPPASPCEEISSDPSRAWGDVLPVLERADAVIVNLETAISDRPFAIFKHPSGFAKGNGFQSSSKTLRILKEGQVSAVSLSNNHIKDIPSGVEETISALQAAGIPFAGAGLNMRQAMEHRTVPARFHGDTKIAFLAASDLRSIRDEKSGWDETADFVKAFRAEDDKPGVWDLATTANTDSLALNYNEADFAPVAQQIKRARRDHDIVVFFLHYQPNLAGFQAAAPYKALARKIIDAGADVFVGNHPHHMQEFESYKGRPLLMGAGELLRSWEYSSEKENPMGYHHEIVYNIHWPAKSQHRSQKVFIDLNLVELHPSECSIHIEHDIDSARDRVRRVNPGKTFGHIEGGLRFTCDDLLPHATYE